MIDMYIEVYIDRDRFGRSGGSKIFQKSKKRYEQIVNERYKNEAEM